ncbi:MAG: hypothetical protein QNJ03_03980 [Dinoroseobacter sp.]|nr:hypothetical protein [Dinoroseobacter sp.]
MAAVETLRRGYARYVIVDTNSQSTSAIGHIPNYSGTGIGTFYDAGSNEVQVLVRMMGPRDPGFSNGIDAKAALGEEWQALVENGITSCY